MGEGGASSAGEQTPGVAGPRASALPPVNAVSATKSGSQEPPPRSGGRIRGLTLALVALGWALAVLIAYYPRPTTAALSSVGLASPTILPSIVLVTVPTQVSLAAIGQGVWSGIGVALLVWAAAALGSRLTDLLGLRHREPLAGSLWTMTLGLGAIAYVVLGLALVGLLTPVALAVMGVSAVVERGNLDAPSGQAPRQLSRC